MTIQAGATPDLFSDPPPAPYQRHSETSRAAALDIMPKAGTLRRRVLDSIIAAGKHGRTDDEIQAFERMDPSTQRPRRIELVEAGLVKDSGQKRMTRSRKPATVWVAA